MRDAAYYDAQASQLESEASAHASAARAARRAGDEDSAMALEQEEAWARQAAGEMRARGRRAG